MIMRTRKTIKASRTAKSRRRISASSRFKRAARPVRASRPIKAARQKIINYLNFSELDDVQKEKAVEVFRESGTAYEWYSDEQMMMYQDQVSIDANELEITTGIHVNTDKIYWQESSQGPYPEWNLRQVFDTYYGTTSNGIDYEIEFENGSMQRSKDTVDAYFSVYNPNDGEWWTGDLGEIDVQDEFLTDSDRKEIGDKWQAAEDFMNDVWRLIEDVCRSYPDDEWCYDTLEANDYEFEVDADGDVIGMA